MNERLNKNSVCSIVVIELLDFLNKSDTEQINVKYSLNQLVSQSLKEYARYDRILLDKGDAIVITYLAAPEDVLSIALDIKTSITQHNEAGLVPLAARIGIHLGTVRVVQDVNEQLNVVGEGLNEALRITQLASPSAIVVTSAFYAVTLPLPAEISEKYAYVGFKQTAQNSEYSAYQLSAVAEIEQTNLAENLTASQEVPKNEIEPTPRAIVDYDTVTEKSGTAFNWTYIALGLVLAIALYGLVRAVMYQSEPEIIMPSSEEATPAVSSTQVHQLEPIAVSQTAVVNPPDSGINGLLPNESLETLPAVSATSHATEVSATSVAQTPSTVAVSATETKQTDVALDNKKAKLKKRSLDAKTKQRKDESSEPLNTQTTPNDARNNQAEQRSEPESKTNNQTDSENASHKDKSKWDAFKESIKQGNQPTCTQGEIALGQCR